jgi:hypothetical protein
MLGACHEMPPVIKTVPSFSSVAVCSSRDTEGLWASFEITGLIEVTPEGGKMSRAAAVSPEVEAGNWYLPHPAVAAWAAEFIEECASFPNGAHDDQVDAWSQGGNYLRGRSPQPNIRLVWGGCTTTSRSKSRFPAGNAFVFNGD